MVSDCHRGQVDRHLELLLDLVNNSLGFTYDTFGRFFNVFERS